MFSLKSPCSCGKMVLTENLNAHQQKKGCLRRRILGQKKAEKGGPDPLYECQCGMVLQVKSQDNHRNGQSHQRFLRYLKEGRDVCPACNIPYKCSKQLHQSSGLHDQCYQRRRQFINQQARKQIRVWQHNERQVQRQQREINQLQVRLQNLEIQQARQEVGQLNEQYDLFHEEIQRQRQMRLARMAQEREAGLRRRQIQQQRRLQAYQRQRNQRRNRPQRMPRNDRVGFIQDQRVQNERRRIEDIARNVQQQQNERHLHRGFTQEQLNQLRPVIVNGHCSICIEDLQNVQGLLLPCNHTFHTDCLKGILRRDSRCPQCRTNLRQERQQPMQY